MRALIRELRLHFVEESIIRLLNRLLRLLDKRKALVGSGPDPTGAVLANTIVDIARILMDDIKHASETQN